MDVDVTIGVPTVQWAVRIEVAPGVIVETLSPMEAGEAAIPFQDERPPWPGLLAWLWRMIAGDRDGGSDVDRLRAVYRATTPTRHHRLARLLSEGQLMAYWIGWQAAQERWCLAVGQQAQRALRAAQEAQPTGHAPDRRPAPDEGEQGEVIMRMPDGTRLAQPPRARRWSKDGVESIAGKPGRV